MAANAEGAGEDTGLETARRTATIMAPYRRRFTQQPLACMSFEPSRAGENNPNRVLTVTMSGLVEDLCLTESLAVAISPAGGVTFAAGRDVYWCDAPHVNSFYCVPDTGTRMRVRLGLGYSLDINENRKLFSKACDVVKRSMARQWDSTQVHLPAALPASRTPQSKPCQPSAQLHTSGAVQRLGFVQPKRAHTARSQVPIGAPVDAERAAACGASPPNASADSGALHQHAAFASAAGLVAIRSFIALFCASISACSRSVSCCFASAATSASARAWLASLAALVRLSAWRGSMLCTWAYAIC